MNPETMQLLVVDDNDLDAEKVVRNLKRLRLKRTVVRAKNGEEALKMLLGSDGTSPLEPPYAVLLDLNMPRMTGSEFLAEISRDSTRQLPPIFVMTTSSRPDDIFRAYRYRICDYVVKPLEAEDLQRIIDVTYDFWEQQSTGEVRKFAGH